MASGVVMEGGPKPQKTLRESLRNGIDRDRDGMTEGSRRE
jgi:hypothetical protein